MLLFPIQACLSLIHILCLREKEEKNRWKVIVSKLNDI